jgi:hypothetical protein
MIKIAIASNVNFYKHTIPVLIPSMLEVGIDPNIIHVFISGYTEYKTYTENNITFHELAHNNYEYSPLVEIVERKLESEYWFLIHDTCKVGPKFKELLYNIPAEKPEKLALKAWPAMSIGTYKYEYLLSVSEKILSIKNTDYSHETLMNWKRWGAPNEDYILWKTEPAPQIYGGKSEWQIMDYDNWYGTGTLRRIEYFPALDIYKNKSNWGHTGHNMVVIV